MYEIFDLLTTPLKAIAIYIAALVLIRLANKRLLGDISSFDFLVAIVLGSVLSRAINGSAPLIPTIIAGAILIFLHWLAATLSYHFPWCRNVLRGKHVTLAKNGQLIRENMEKTHISKDDLLIQLRKRQGTESIEDIAKARIETSGSITFVLKKDR